MSTCEVMCSQTEHFAKDSNVISSKLANDLDAKLTSSSKQVLLKRVEFKAASKPDEQYEKLKKKYKPLNQNSSLVNGKATSHVSSSKQDDLPEPKTVLCNPDKISLRWSKMRRVGPGLSNLGNTCYLNSVIQVLTYTAPLVNFLSTQEHTRECRAVGFCMMCELQRHVLRSFSHHQNESIKPQAIIQKLRCIAKHLRFGHQEDAHEFLRYVIDGMQKSCLHGYEKLDKASKETTVIHRIFSGYYRSQVRCLMCHNTSSTYDPLMDVMLDIKQTPTITRALQRLCKAELLDGDNLYYCLKCKKKVPAHKQVLIHKTPNVLTVQLKRFDSNHIFGGKVTKSVEYTEYLDLRPFMTSKGGPVKYKLYGVLVHSGYSSNSGHYYCYVRSSNNMWYNMNDSVVRQVGLNAALSQQAYLLFYIKMVDSTSQQEEKPCSPIPTKTVQAPQPGPKVIKENDFGMPVSRLSKPEFLNTYTIPKKTPKPSPSIIPSEQRPKLSFTIKSPTRLGKNKNEAKNVQSEHSLNQDDKQVESKDCQAAKKSSGYSQDLAKGSTEPANEKQIINSWELEPPEPIEVSLPVKKDEKRTSPSKKPPQLFIPRSVQTKSSATETKPLEEKNVSITTPVKATTPWKVTPQTSNNYFTYGPMSPPPKGTPLPQPSPSSVTSEGSSTSSKTAKTGEWSIKDKRIPTPGPILPERQHAGWIVSEKSGIEKVDHEDDEESWVEAAEGTSKKSKKKRKKEKRKELKKYQKLDEEGENDREEAKDERKQNSDKENKKKHKKKKKKKEKSKRESDKEELLKDNFSEKETEEKLIKRKKRENSHEGESKRQRLVDYTSDESSIGDQNNNRLENTQERNMKTRADVPVVVYNGDQHEKTSHKSTWDGCRDNATVNKLLKGNKGVFGYGDKVTAWEGGQSLVNVEKNERKRERTRDYWDQELDKGKTKKVKGKTKDDKFSGTNFFQREHDRRNKKGFVDRASSHFTRRHSSSHSRHHSSRGYRRL